MISVLPQLPCKNRYTEDWIRVWTRELKRLGIPFIMLGEDKAIPITKYFTDPLKALAYESEQISVLARDNPSKIFCLDVEFPGLISPAVQALRLMNSDLKAFGYLHAGSWADGDVWSETKGRRHLDRMIFDVFDKVFVASTYHKKKIEKHYGEEFDNLIVVGFPFYRKDVEAYVKPLPFEEKKGILISGRAEQSNTDLLDRLRKKLDIEILTITAIGRKGYYEQLNQAKVVLSLKTEETFGLSQLEAYVLGSIPLSLDNFSYSEIVRNKYLLYSDEKDLMDKLAYLISLEKNLFHIDMEQYEHTIERCMQGLL